MTPKNIKNQSRQEYWQLKTPSFQELRCQDGRKFKTHWKDARGQRANENAATDWTAELIKKQYLDYR